VAVGCGKPDQRISTVSIDDYDAAYRMTSHLIALGHERIGFVAGHPDQTASERRLAGYRAAITAKGVAMSEDLVAHGLFTYLSGMDAAERLLSLEKRPTAIFASNEDMAVAVVDVAHRFELKIPADLTVAGFGDTALATSIWPALTTVRQPIADMASAALQSLVRRVRALRNGEQAPPEHLCAEFVIVRRQSEAAPRFNPQVHQSILDAVSAIQCSRADN
jgi:LacI family transcriptional regulator